MVLQRKCSQGRTAGLTGQSYNVRTFLSKAINKNIQLVVVVVATLFNEGNT